MKADLMKADSDCSHSTNSADLFLSMLFMSFTLRWYCFTPLSTTLFECRIGRMDTR